MVAGQNIPLRVGVVLEMDDFGDMVLSCIMMSLSDFYSTHDHYTTRLVLTNCDSKEDVTGAAAAGTQPSHIMHMILYLRLIYDDHSNA